MRVRKGLIFGVGLLLVVDVLWVGSAGISRHLFHDDHYNKPLFWTYFKTTLFSFYLAAFLFWRPWQRLCWEGFQRRGREHSDGNGVGRWGAINGVRVLAKDKSPAVLEADTSCGIDETTGQCTHTQLPQNDTSPVTSSDSVSGERERQCEEADITTELCTEPDDEDTHLLTQCREEKHYGDTCSSVGGETGGAVFEPEMCPAVLDGSGGGNRHARVVDGRLFFNTASLNGDTCPVNPPLETCRIDTPMLGPPEFQQLNCTLSEEDRCQTGPLSPCSTKCCKVRFNRTIEVREAKCRITGRGKTDRKGAAPLLPVWKVATLSLVFGIVWFFANYLYALALVSKSVALVNTLSSMSSVFVVIMAALPILHQGPGDRITLSRILVTLLSVGGAVLVSISDSTETDHKYWSPGALFSLGGAFLYAVYLVLLKKLVPDPDSLELPMFFGFVGLFNTVLMLPLVVVWHYTGVERFEWPPSSDVWTLLLINGFVGTVISELMWLCGVFLTSPLVGTLSLALVTPLSITYSVFIGQHPFSDKFFIGALMIAVCFVIVTILDHFGSWDPLWALIKKAITAARDYRTHRGYDSLSEESKRLIENKDNSSVDQFFPVSGVNV